MLWAVEEDSDSKSQYNLGLRQLKIMKYDLASYYEKL